MFDPITILLYSVAGVALIVGSISDLRTREVPDWLSYGLMFGGLGIRLIVSLATFSWLFFFEGVVGFIALVILGYLMFYSGQWGGGDSKLIMGLGAVIGLPLSVNGLPPLAMFLVATLFIGGVYGMAWIVGLGVKHRARVGKELIKLKQGSANIKSVVTWGSLALAVLLVLLWSQNKAPLYTVVLAFSPIALYYGWLVIKSIEQVAFIRFTLPEHLTEGDWIVDDVIVDGQKICGPSDLGIEKEQIAKLIRLRNQGKIDMIKIKDGVPFVPSFLLAFVALLLLQLVL